MDWILSDAIKRHMLDTNEGRRGVLIRAVTRAIPQKIFLENLRTHGRYKKDLAPGTTLKPAGAGADWGPAVDESSIAPWSDAEILAAVREDCLRGAYYLVDWRGYAGYEPGENVVHLFSMGSPTTEAIEASQRLSERGIFANVIVISSPELLLGILGEKDGYRHLREGLGVTGDLHAVRAAGSGGTGTAELIGLAGRRVPIVAICDGEAGLVDNIGSIVGVRQVTQAVRRFSKCGRPDQVFRYQGLDADSIVDAAGRVLAETALEDLQIAPSVLSELSGMRPFRRPSWRDLWPEAGPDA